MREILFRGLTLGGEWVEGNYSHVKQAINMAAEPGHYISNSAGVPFAYRVIPSTIGMFTGLHDLDGKRIFEGDVLIDKYGVEYKVYCKYGVSGVTKLGYRVATDFPENIAEMQVTSNIHES